MVTFVVIAWILIGVASGQIAAWDFNPNLRSLEHRICPKRYECVVWGIGGIFIWPLILGICLTLTVGAYLQPLWDWLNEPVCK